MLTKYILFFKPLALQGLFMIMTVIIITIMILIFSKITINFTVSPCRCISSFFPCKSIRCFDKLMITATTTKNSAKNYQLTRCCMRLADKIDLKSIVKELCAERNQNSLADNDLTRQIPMQSQ